MRNKKIKINWSIVAGIILLLFALGLLINSNTDKQDIITTDTNVSSDAEPYPSALTEHTSVVTDNTVNSSKKETTSKHVSQKKTSGNSSKNKKSTRGADYSDYEFPYMLKVNRTQNFVMVYSVDSNGEYTIPYKIFICSTGREEGDTPLGTFEVGERYRWRMLVDGSYGQYAVRIYGQIMFHSVPYTDSSKDSLEYYEYNKLGKGASLGCIRLQASDIKWIYDNCKEGTTVTIYDDSDEIPPLDIPKIKKIKKSNPNRYWDPTDPSKKNPWKKLNNKSVKHTNKLSKKIRKSIQTIWDKYDLLGKEKPLWLKNITQ